MEIQTARLLLRELQESDWIHMAHYEADPEVRQKLLRSERSPKAAQQFVVKARQHIMENPRTFYALALVPLDSDELIGICTLWIAPDPPLSNGSNSDGPEKLLHAGLGWTIDKRFWRQGYATEASHSLLKLAFETHGVQRVTADCYASNIASRRVMEKLGMKCVKSYRHRGWNKASMQFLLNPAVHYELKRCDWTPL